MGKRSFKGMLFLLLLSCAGKGQDTAVVISPQMFDPINEIMICRMEGWDFRKKGDSAWVRLKPTALSAAMADPQQRLEGWLRFRFRLDPAFTGIQLGLRYTGWAAAVLYVDGKRIKNFGLPGTDAASFREYNPSNKLPVPMAFVPGGEHEILIHFADYRNPLFPRRLKSQATGLDQLIRITGPGYQERLKRHIWHWPVYTTFWVSTCTILTLLFWLLSSLNRREKNLALFAVCATLFLFMFCFKILSEDPGIGFRDYQLSIWGFNLFSSFSSCLSLVIVARIFKGRVARWLKATLWILLLMGILNTFLQTEVLAGLGTLITVVIYIGYIISSRKTLRGAQWAIVYGLSLFTILTVLYIAMIIRYQTDFFPNNMLVASGVILSFPVSLLIYVALRFKEMLAEVRMQAAQVLQLSEEKKEQALHQQKLLEEEVARQTVELRTSLENLKAAQHQLVQSEKMASLGELTAGIAHEIQNPLNFVNNFSEVNQELAGELKAGLEAGKLELVKEIADDIGDNSEKISHHGKRAEAIVRGMLQHSRSSSGQKESTAINALCEEYLRLAYHGHRAKDKSFNATLKTDFDDSIGKISIIPQDIGRVLLNLINNAFYACKERFAQSNADKDRNAITEREELTANSQKLTARPYVPMVSLTTKRTGNSIEIRVADNGNGIPQKILDKIFQPFFTTKPTGQGTGLGLSLSYDIVKSHGGALAVETKEGEGTEFIVRLPVN